MGSSRNDPRPPLHERLPNDATELNDQGDTTGYRVWSRDASWAQVEGAKVRQAGPRRPWDAVEEVHSWFESRAHPSRGRFGVTIIPGAQHYWPDEPDTLVPLLA